MCSIREERESKRQKEIKRLKPEAVLMCWTWTDIINGNQTSGEKCRKQKRTKTESADCQFRGSRENALECSVMSLKSWVILHSHRTLFNESIRGLAVPIETHTNMMYYLVYGTSYIIIVLIKHLLQHSLLLNYSSYWSSWFATELKNVR